MFKNELLIEKLVYLINLGEIEKAFLFIRTNSKNITNKLMVKGWLLRNYKIGDVNWLNFWKGLAYSKDVVNKRTQSYIYKRSITFAIENQDIFMVLEILKRAPKSGIKSLLGLLARNAISDTNFTLNTLKEIKSNGLKSFFYTNLIKEGIVTYNGLLLQDLKKLHNGKIFNYGREITLLSLNSHEKQILNKLIHSKKEHLIYINKKMKPFVSGVGNIDYDAGLLAIAVRKNRKSYNYNPTLINNYDEKCMEFEKYLTMLKEAFLPLTERFVLSSYHWISGEIDIDENGLAQILFVDSLGSHDKQGELEVYDATKEAIKCFSTLFPNGKIFLSRDQRQNDVSSCQVYALDDTAHLFRLHLEDSYNKTNLWGYLNDSLPKKTTKKFSLINKNGSSVNVAACNLPLSLMRTMQSRKLLDKIIPNRTKSEQSTFVNKKKETAFSSSAKFFKSVPTDSNSRRLQNTRISYKLDNLKKNIINFLLEKKPDEIEKLMLEPTLEGFMKRIKTTSTSPSLNN